MNYTKPVRWIAFYIAGGDENQKGSSSWGACICEAAKKYKITNFATNIISEFNRIKNSFATDRFTSVPSTVMKVCDTHVQYLSLVEVADTRFRGSFYEDQNLIKRG